MEQSSNCDKTQFQQNSDWVKIEILQKNFICDKSQIVTTQTVQSFLVTTLKNLMKSIKDSLSQPCIFFLNGNIYFVLEQYGFGTIVLKILIEPLYSKPSNCL